MVYMLLRALRSMCLEQMCGSLVGCKREVLRPLRWCSVPTGGLLSGNKWRHCAAICQASMCGRVGCSNHGQRLLVNVGGCLCVRTNSLAYCAEHPATPCQGCCVCRCGQVGPTCSPCAVTTDITAAKQLTEVVRLRESPWRPSLLEAPQLPCVVAQAV